MTTIEAWRAEAEAVRGRYMAPGVSSVDTLKGQSGLAFLKGILEGRVPPPPITAVLNFALVQAEDGYAVFQGEPLPEFYNPIGSIHGGWASTLLDSCMACAVQTKLPQGSGYATVELKVNMVRALSSQTGPVRAEGKIVNAGRTISTAEGRLVGADGKLYAHGSTTCLIMTL